MKIALVANTCWYLYNFRRNLIVKLIAEGHQVIAIGGADGYGKRLESEGICHKDLTFSQTGVNPFRELQTVYQLRQFLNDEVDIALSWTPKGNIYAALALVGLKTQLVSNVSGLGRAFIHRTWVTSVVRQLLKYALSKARVVFFQNSDDRHQFIAQGLVHEKRTRLLPGSGVDLIRFRPRPTRPLDGEFRVLMVSRLLWSKGVQEYVEAARSLRKDDANWRFQILGAIDGAGSSAVTPDELQSWVSEGVIDYLGATDDVRNSLAEADCVVLPSYREGLPRSMLEAAAMGRPIMTTDVPGCRDCVEEGVNGFLFSAGSAEDLVRVLIRFKSMDVEGRIAMGGAGRAKVEAEFDERTVIAHYMAVINELQ